MPQDTPQKGGAQSSDLAVIYHNRFDRDEDYRNQVWKTLIAGWFQKHIPVDSTALDLVQMVW